MIEVRPRRDVGQSVGKAEGADESETVDVSRPRSLDLCVVEAAAVQRS